MDTITCFTCTLIYVIWLEDMICLICHYCPSSYYTNLIHAFWLIGFKNSTVPGHSFKYRVHHHCVLQEEWNHTESMSVLITGWDTGQQHMACSRLGAGDIARAGSVEVVILRKQRRKRRGRTNFIQEHFSRERVGCSCNYKHTCDVLSLAYWCL